MEIEIDYSRQIRRQSTRVVTLFFLEALRERGMLSEYIDMYETDSYASLSKRDPIFWVDSFCWGDSEFNWIELDSKWEDHILSDYPTEASLPRFINPIDYLLEEAKFLTVSQLSLFETVIGDYPYIDRKGAGHAH